MDPCRRFLTSPVGSPWKPDKNNFAPRVGIAWDVFGDGKPACAAGMHCL